MVDHRCYGDLSVRGHQVEGADNVERAGEVCVGGDDGDGCRGEVLQSICSEVSKLE